MTLSWSDLDVQDRARFRAATAFLKGRLAEPEIVHWALRLKPDRKVERTAIFELLTDSDVPQLREPYATAWPLVLDSWSYSAAESFSASSLLQIRRRLERGDRSGNLVDAIANLVAPRLQVKASQTRLRLPTRQPRRPKKLGDLLSVGLTSASLLFDFQSHRIDFGLDLDNIADVAFLHALACALMSAVDRGHYIARRIYGENEGGWYADASPLRVYCMPPETAAHDRDSPGGRVFDPDAVTRGMGTAVKLLHAILQRIAELDTGMARSFLGRWRYSDMVIYQRLWAAAARNAETVSPAEVGEFLMALEENYFWDFTSFPEFAELRAKRFMDLAPETQALIARRLCKGQPRKWFPRKMGAEEIRTVKRQVSAIELRRIEIGGGILPARERDWLVETADEFPGLEKMTIDGGFRGPWVLPYFPPSASRKTRFDELEGEARLQALEDALSDETSVDQASGWLQQSDHVLHILHDLKNAAPLADCFPYLWDRFGHMHTQPGSQSEGETPRNVESEAAQVLSLMNRLSDATVEAAIDGVCYWLYMWSGHVIGSNLGRQVWLRAWPYAVKVTNSTEAGDDKNLSDTTIRLGTEDRSSEEINGFQLPVGKLLRVFLELVQLVDEKCDPIDDASIFAQMRDCAIAAQGHSGLIVHCQFTRKLPEFLRIDPVWAGRHLIEPLLVDDEKSILLWRAVALTWIDSEGLKIIGGQVAKRVVDSRLGKKARKNLLSCMVHEGLTALKDRREPAVPQARISQILRAADDEIREWAAFDIWFFQDYEYKVGQESNAARTSFLSAVKPFLKRVWPQERSLSTAGVSSQLSHLPAVSGGAFTGAVDEIERFLVPFDCSSMLSYGFYEGDMSEQLGMPKLSEVVDDAPKALALLRLLDLTIGDTQSATIPEDLSVALDRIESEAPSSKSDPAFRRLAAAARR